MADDIETVDVQRERPTRKRVGPFAGVPEGAITGAGMGAVFGGPIGALIGAGVGILSRRVRQSMLDAEAAGADVANQLNRAVAESVDVATRLPGLSDVQREELAAIDSQREKLSQAMLDPDPAVRRQAKLGMINLSTAPVLNEVQKRADTLADAAQQARAHIRDQYHSEINSTIGTIDTDNTGYDSLINAVNDKKLGDQSAVTQGLFVKYMSGSEQDPAGGIPFIDKLLGHEPGKPYT